MVDSAWHEHAPFAAWLIEAHQPALLVELGAHNGFSYAAFCESVKRAGLSTKARAIDTWQGDEHAGFYGDDVFARFNAYHASRYASFSELIRSRFADAVDTFADKSIDLLHIDGRHHYDDVREDFDLWRPKLSDRAVVLFHDTVVRERNFGVFKLWEELAPSYAHFEFEHGHGLGVLGVGGEQTTSMRALFDARLDPATTDAIRMMYAHLGRAITDHWDLAMSVVRFRKELVERDAEIARLRDLAAAAAVKSMRA